MSSLLSNLKRRFLPDTFVHDWRMYVPLLERVKEAREGLRSLGDDELREHWAAVRAHPADEILVSSFAIVCLAVERTIGLQLFDVQILGALALVHGKIAEMQTGEGKTVTAVLPVAFQAALGEGMHVLTANDYLARRDAEWMGPAYRFLGLSVSAITQASSAEERRAAYASDITYATANEVGFDYLRDGLSLHPNEMVQRPFHAALIDEVDSILIDEARIPLVIAGGSRDEGSLAYLADSAVRQLRRGVHFVLDEYARNVSLTDSGIRQVEAFLRCANLYAEENLPLLTAVQDALQAHVLLRRNVDYLVKNNAIESVDELKGRIAQNRRWPEGLQTAIEAKEGLFLRGQGTILGSVTLQNLVAMYARISGMTGTAQTQAREFASVYKLDVVPIPTNRPVIRIDYPDRIFPIKAAKRKALLAEIQAVHSTGRPVLVGTASVEESLGMGRLLRDAGVPHQVLNAQNDELEAGIIAQAGSFGAVTISTNMAGRGTDIQLGGSNGERADEIRSLGGLYVIGTNRHESRRIDNQLRGRAGRQGDPGASCFFVSLEDDLMVRYGIGEMLRVRPEGAAIDAVQRVMEGQNLEIRRTLWKYEGVIERQRREVRERREEVLFGAAPSILAELDPERWRELRDLVGGSKLAEAERRVTLILIDELWSGYLAEMAELRNGIHWVGWGGRDPLHSFLAAAVEAYPKLMETLENEVVRVLREAVVRDGELHVEAHDSFERGATWTYLVNDQPFGSWADRMAAGIKRKLSSRRLFG